MNSKKYWEKRAVQNLFERMEDAEEAAREIAKFYGKSTAYFQRQAKKVFEKYASKHGITRIEAKKLLDSINSPEDVTEILNRLDGVKKGSGLKAKLESPAYRHRIERYIDMQKQVDAIMQNVYKQEKNYSDRFYRDFIRRAYYKKAYDLTQRIGAAVAFGYISEKEIDTILNTKWYGKNYSQRIWGSTQAVAQAVKDELFMCFVTGQTEREAAQNIAEKFQKGLTDARRLIRTESAYLSNQMDQRAYKEFDIKKYRFLATLDLKTSDICRRMDGKIFLVSEAVVGKNKPPMHPWCRSTTIEIVNEKYLDKMKRRARDPITGKTELVPMSMTYEDWYKKNVKGTKAQELDEVWKNGQIPDDEPAKADTIMRFERDKDGNLIAVDDDGKKIGSITTSDGAYEERKDKR